MFFVTENGGVNWIEVIDCTSEDFYQLTFLNDDFGMLVGDDYFVHTFDGGLNWIGGGYYSGPFETTWDVEIVGDLEAYAVKDDGLLIKYD